MTVEILERRVHLARESGVAFIAAGHHATERFGLVHPYIEVDNPV